MLLTSPRAFDHKPQKQVKMLRFHGYHNFLSQYKQGGAERLHVSQIEGSGRVSRSQVERVSKRKCDSEGGGVNGSKAAGGIPFSRF